MTPPPASDDDRPPDPLADDDRPPDPLAGIDPPATAGVDPPANAGVDPPANAGVDPPANAGVDPPANAGVDPPANAGVDPPARPAASLGNWSVLAVLATAFLSAAAALAQATVLGKQVYDLTGSKLDLGLLGLAEFAPAALLVLVTGSVADRLDRRRVAAVSMAGEAGVSVALAWYAGSGRRSVAPIFGMVLAFGVARAFAAPANRALPADIVPPDKLSWLIPRYSAMWQAAIIAGPVLGGLLYTVDLRLPYVLDAVLLVTAAAFVLSVRSLDPGSPAHMPPTPSLEAAVEPSEGHGTSAPAARAGWRDALEGLRFIRGQQVLLGAISLDLFAVLFGGAVALLPAIAKDRLGVGAVGLGWLRASGGIGAAAVTLGLAARPLARRVGRVLLTVVAAFGAGTIALGLTHSYVVAFIALAVLSGADAVSVFIRATLVPLVTPDTKRGRVMAVENVFIGASNELGAFESGVTAQLMGTAGSVVLGGVATLAVATSWWFLFPGLREIDRFPGDDPLPITEAAGPPC